MADERCYARRVHPYSSDYFVRCERAHEHEGPHCKDGVEWTDDSAYALAPIATAPARRPMRSAV